MDSKRVYERHYAWIGLGALWIIGFIGAISRFIMASYQVQMSEDLDVGRGFISAAWSTNLFIAALCAPIGGKLVDRYGPRKVMLLASLFGISGTGLVYLGHQPVFFFTGYGILSGLAGLSASTAYVLIFQWFGRHKAKAAGILSSASSVGLAVCTPVFLSNENLTWEYAFMISALMGLILTIPLILFVIRPDKGNVPTDGKSETGVHAEKTDESSVAPTLRERLRWPLFIVAFALFTCGLNMGTVEMNLVAIHQQSDVSPGTIAQAMGILGVMEIVGSLAFGFLMDVADKRLSMMLLYGIRILGFWILLIHAPWSPAVFAVAFGITYLGAVPGGMLIAGQYANRKGSLVGNLMLFHQAGGILGALIGGLAYDAFGSYQVLIGLDAVLCGMAAAGYAVLKLRQYSRKGEMNVAA
ncbi:MFS transporter [Cohnella candidum]|uniref:MFS transporter n=1 Tax=Cohnella candidum TaxID=2674991 RepID=A0A3G3JVT5_9BACL|nr:MFS transporter [Cohnella candidum]AYQ72342.1 MFS transporter [Cohnella candidum]